MRAAVFFAGVPVFLLVYEECGPTGTTSCDFGLGYRTYNIFFSTTKSVFSLSRSWWVVRITR
jgi:hypothetical protein